MKIITKVVLLLSLSYVWTYHKDMKTFLQKCTSECNREYCNVTIVCKPINRTSKRVTVDVNFHPGITVEAPFYIELNAYKKFTTVYRPFMIKLKEEFCAQLIAKTHIIYKLLGREYVETIGNMFDPCPFTGYRYMNPQISNVDSIMFPLIPVGEWRFDFVLSKNINGSEVLVVSMSFFYEIKPSGAAEF